MGHFKIPSSHLSPPPLPPPPPPPLSLSSASHAAPCSTSTPNAAEGPSRTLRESHTGVSVTGETAPNPSTHQPLAFSSPPLLPTPPLRHHCSFLHLSSSSCPIFFLLLASVGQDFHSLCFEPQTWLLRPETDLHWERQSSHFSLAFSALSL